MITNWHYMLYVLEKSYVSKQYKRTIDICLRYHYFGYGRIEEKDGMGKGKVEVARSHARLLGTICVAMALLAASCGGGGGIVPTASVSASASSLSPSNITIASQPVGVTSAPQSVTLSNSGSAALSIVSLGFTGTNPGDFSQTNDCGSTVAAGANCTISVTFQPSATGTRTADLLLNNDSSSSQNRVRISGTGTASEASLAPSTLTFASQAIGDSTAAQTLTLANTGNAALSISSIAISGTNASDFAQTNTCGNSVAASANCLISITFKPSATGTRVATVALTDNAPSSPQSVALTGTIATTAAEVSPSSLAFGNQQLGTSSGSQSITLTNTGNAALSVSNISISGANAGDFAQTNNCGSSVAAGSNCAVGVTFAPTAAGSRVATLSVADSAAGSPQVVALSGSGASAGVSLSSTSVAFGNQAVGIVRAIRNLSQAYITDIVVSD